MRYRSLRVFSLTGWSPLIQTRFSRVSSYSGSARRLGISDTRLSLSPAGLPSPFSYLTSATTQSEPRDARITVWALSISLAATLEIDKFSFSSSGYLDVSVPRVPPRTAMYSLHADRGFLCRVSPIQISPDHWICAPPRSFSQLITSFIGS